MRKDELIFLISTVSDRPIQNNAEAKMKGRLLIRFTEELEAVVKKEEEAAMMAAKDTEEKSDAE